MRRRIRAKVWSIIDSMLHKDVAEILEFIGKKFGLKEDLLNYLHIEIRNKLNEEEFKQVPKNERIILLPHCLRHKDCPCKYNEFGLVCDGCEIEECQIFRIRKLAKERGCETYVLPGGSMVKKIVKEKRPKAVIGVACYEEANLGMDKLKEVGIPCQAVLLLKDGCKDTLVDIDEIKEKMDLDQTSK